MPAVQNSSKATLLACAIGAADWRSEKPLDWSAGLQRQRKSGRQLLLKPAHSCHREVPHYTRPVSRPTLAITVLHSGLRFSRATIHTGQEHFGRREWCS